VCRIWSLWCEYTHLTWKLPKSGDGGQNLKTWADSHTLESAFGLLKFRRWHDWWTDATSFLALRFVSVYFAVGDMWVNLKADDIFFKYNENKASSCRILTTRLVLFDTGRFLTKTYLSFVHQSDEPNSAIRLLKADLNSFLCLLEIGQATFSNVGA